MDKVVILILLLLAIACGSPSQSTDESRSPDTYTPPDHEDGDWPDVRAINEPSSSHGNSPIIYGDFSDLTKEEETQVSVKQIGDHLIADRILIYNPYPNDLHVSLGVEGTSLDFVKLDAGKNWMSERFAHGARPVVQFPAGNNNILQYDLKLASQYLVCWSRSHRCLGLKEVDKRKK